jgi:hypothetical protein
MELKLRLRPPGAEAEVEAVGQHAAKIRQTVGQPRLDAAGWRDGWEEGAEGPTEERSRVQRPQRERQVEPASEVREKARPLDAAEEAEQWLMMMQLRVTLEQLPRWAEVEQARTPKRQGKGTARAPVAVCAKVSDARVPPMTLSPTVGVVRIPRSQSGSD